MKDFFGITWWDIGAAALFLFSSVIITGVLGLFLYGAVS